MQEVYDNFDFLKRLTEKRFPDPIMADEAYSYAFEMLTQNNWRRARAFQGKSSFRSYLGVVWCRLLEDFSIKKYGKVTAPKWIQQLGSVWREMFHLLCCRWFSVTEAVENIIAQGRHAWSERELESAADEILAKIPSCGQKKIKPPLSLDEPEKPDAAETFCDDVNPAPEELVMEKERWVALKALAKVFFTQTGETPCNQGDADRMGALVLEIRKHLPLNQEEQLILTAHFVDGWSVTDIGKRLGYNANQIHGKFRRLMAKIKTTLPALLDSYL